MWIGTLPTQFGWYRPYSLVTALIISKHASGPLRSSSPDTARPLRCSLRESRARWPSPALRSGPRAAPVLRRLRPARTRSRWTTRSAAARCCLPWWSWGSRHGRSGCLRAAARVRRDTASSTGPAASRRGSGSLRSAAAEPEPASHRWPAPAAVCSPARARSAPAADAGDRRRSSPCPRTPPAASGSPGSTGVCVIVLISDYRGQLLIFWVIEINLFI